MWTVSHYWHNPANNTVRQFPTRRAAIEEARRYQSDDSDDTQCSYIENKEQGVCGVRRWGKKNIQWGERILK